MKNSRAIILAAGFGIRLEAITMHKPKCMVRVCGKPILEYQLDAYDKLDLDEIIIVTGYKSEIIENYVKQRNKKNIKIINNTNYHSSNNMYSLWLCREELKESNQTFISNADVLFDMSILKRLSDKSGSYIICQKGTFNDESMKVSTLDDGSICDISKTIAEENSFGCSIDVYSFSNQVSNKLVNKMSNIIEKEKDLNQWTEVAIQQLVKSKSVTINPFCLKKEERWFEIDTMSDLVNAEIVFSPLSQKLKNKKGFIFDLDGTIYIGENAIDGAKNLLDKLKVKKCITKFLSNNSSKNKIEYSKKLQNQGIAAKTEDIVLSTDVAIKQIKSMGYTKGYIVGTESMKKTLKNSELFHDSQKPEFVLIGYDTELNYEKLSRASLLISSGLPYFATHSDNFCPTPSGPIPDAGSIIELFKTATNQTPIVFGKPRRTMIEYIIKDKNNFKNFVFIGDRLRTDFDMCKKVNLDFICVLSGETKREELENELIWPSLIVRSVNDLTNLI